MKARLSVKIIGIVFLLSAVLFASLIYLYTDHYTNGITDAFVDRAKATANSLNSAIDTREDLYDKNKLMSIIQKSIWLDPDIVDISFVFPDGGAMSTYIAFDMNNINKAPDKDNQNSYRNDILIDKTVQNNEKRILRVITPIHLSGQIVGTVQIDFTLENINKEILNATTFFIMIYIVMLIAFIAFLFYFLRLITIKPITEINKGMESISKGNLNYKIKVKTKDELGNLAGAFNKMTLDLKKSRAELEGYSKTLEKKVKDRTKELESKNKELETFNKLAIGRELKMIELKKKIKELQDKINKKGQP